MTFVGALRLSDVTAPMTFDGAMGGTAFLAYVERILGPTLNCSDIVVMDTCRLMSFRPCGRQPNGRVS